MTGSNRAVTNPTTAIELSDMSWTRWTLTVRPETTLLYPENLLSRIELEAIAVFEINLKARKASLFICCFTNASI
jgi:hypothetical protein